MYVCLYKRSLLVCNFPHFSNSRTQLPRGLRRGSAAARLFGLRVRIPPEAWMYVCRVCSQLEVSVTGRSLVQSVRVWSRKLKIEEVSANEGCRVIKIVSLCVLRWLPAKCDRLVRQSNVGERVQASCIICESRGISERSLTITLVTAVQPKTVHCSLFTVHCSLFTVHCSLFTV